MSSLRFIVFFFVFAGCSFFSLATAQYSVNLPYKQISVEKSGNKAIFDTDAFICEQGRPKLPSYSISILIPPEIDFEDVTVKLKDLTYQDLPETFEVDPSEIVDSSRLPDGIADKKDTSVYRSNSFFPSEFKGKVVFDRLWHYKVVRVTVYPYLYNPVQNRLRKLTGGSICLSFDAKQPNANNKQRIFEAENTLRDIIVNPEVLELYGTMYAINSFSAPTSVYTNAPLGKQYVIITTNAIYTGCKNKIDNYKTHLESIGYDKVEIVTETEWQFAATASERSNNIRAWIIDYASNGNTDYNVLLIGNPNPENGDVPMYYVTNHYPSWGTDYFYGDLDAELTDLDANLQEVVVGRIPVYRESDYSRVNDYLQKVIDYESSSNIEWRSFALLPIVPCFELGWNDFSIGNNIKQIMNLVGWESRRLFEPYGWNNDHKGFYPAVVNAMPLAEVPFCNPGIVVNNWNNYTPGLVVWHTHGNSKNAVSVLSVNDISGLKTNYPAIVFSGSCDVAKPQERGNLGTELMYSKSAIVFVGSAGDFIVEQIKLIAPGFASYIAQNLSVGDAIKNIHKNGVYNEENKRIVLYGCPEVRVNIPQKTLGIGPQNLTLLRTNSNQVKLSWDTVSNAQSYVIERAEQSSGRKRADGWKNIGTVTGNVEYIDNSVVSNKVYLYRVWAENSTAKSGYSAVDSISTYSQSLLPQPPENMNVIPDCYAAIISWDQPATVQSGTYYNVKRRHINQGSSTQCEFGVVENTVQAKDIFDCDAEKGALSGSAQVGTTYEDFEGTGYVDGFVSSITAAVSFETKVLVEGDYTLSLRYSAANGNSTNIGLYVNNRKVKNITCQQTVDQDGNGSWNVWSKQSETVRLNSGINNIEYRAESASANSIVIDQFYVKAVNSYIDNNLLPGEEYEYTVSTVNKYGESENCNPTVIVKPVMRVPTVAPVLDHVDNVSCNAFEYYWNNPIENARLCNEIQYSYDKKLPGGGTENVSGLMLLNRNWSMYALDGFENDQEIEFRFRTRSTISGELYVSDWSETYTVTTGRGTPPNLPQVTLSKLPSGKIQLSFEPDLSGNEISGCQIYRKNGDVFALVKEVNSIATPVEFDPLEVATDYFVIRVYNSSDCGKNYSEYSDVISFSEPRKYEAEDALLENGANVNTDHPGYSGSGFVDGFWRKENANVTFTVMADQSADYTLKLRYSAGNGTSYCMGLYVNGNKIKNLTCPGTGNWDSWGEITERIHLESGTNTITYKSEWYSSESINIDYIEYVVISSGSPDADLKVYTLDQTLGNNQQTQPRFYIRNDGDTPLSNYSMRYYFTVENGQTPVFESYYMPSYCTASIEQVSGDVYCVLLTFNNTLEAGGRIPQAENDGFNFGLHYQNYTNVWNQGNDFSQPSGNNFTLTDKVAVFNSSNKLIYGTMP